MDINHQAEHFIIGGSVDPHLFSKDAFQRKIIFISLGYEIYDLYPHFSEGILCKK